MGFLKQKAVQEYKGEIDKIARELIDSLTEEEKLSCDPSALVFEFAISVICKLFMGYKGSREIYGKIVRALVSIGKRISDSILHQTQTPEEKKEYQTALSMIRELIQCNIESDGPLPAGLKEKGFRPLATKLYLFFFYLAGTETTSAVTHSYIMGRALRKDKLLTLRGPGNTLFWSKLLRKGHYAISWTFLSAWEASPGGGQRLLCCRGDSLDFLT